MKVAAGPSPPRLVRGRPLDLGRRPRLVRRRRLRHPVARAQVGGSRPCGRQEPQRMRASARRLRVLRLRQIWPSPLPSLSSKLLPSPDPACLVEGPRSARVGVGVRMQDRGKPQPALPAATAATPAGAAHLPGGAISGLAPHPPPLCLPGEILNFVGQRRRPWRRFLLEGAALGARWEFGLRREVCGGCRRQQHKLQRWWGSP